MKNSLSLQKPLRVPNIRCQYFTHSFHQSYLSTLQWTIDTADLDVAMFSPWDDLQSLKVTAQNHHVTTRSIGLWREKWTELHDELLQLDSHTGASVTASNKSSENSSAAHADKIRLLFSCFWDSQEDSFAWVVMHCELWLLHRGEIGQK